MGNKKINAKAFAQEIKAGSVNDEELIVKYQLSSKAVLEKLLSKLAVSGLVTQNDIDNRNKAKFGAKDPAKIVIPHTKTKKDPEAVKNNKPKEISHKYKITGGSFGLGGTLVVSDNTFNVFSTQKVSFKRDHVQDIVLSEGKKEKKFNVLNFAGGFMLTIIVSSVIVFFVGDIVRVFVYSWFCCFYSF